MVIKTSGLNNAMTRADQDGPSRSWPAPNPDPPPLSSPQRFHSTLFRPNLTQKLIHPKSLNKTDTTEETS